MKKLLALLFLTLLFPQNIFAQAEASVSANPQNTHQGIYFEVSDKSQLIGKTVTDDAYIISSDSNINSVIKKDLIVLSADSRIEGVVEQDLRIIGGNIVIDAQIFGNVTIVGNNVTISEKAIFYRNVNVLANKIKINGDILGKSDIFAMDTQVNTIINDEWNVRTQNLTFGEKFDPQNNFTYYSPQEFSQATNSANIKYIQANLEELNIFNNFKPNKFLEYFSFVLRLFKTTYLLFSLFLGYLILKLASPRIDLSQKFNSSQIKQNIRIGFRIFFLTLLSISLLVGFIITIPAAVILSSFLTFALFLANTISSFIVGREILLKLKLGQRRGFALLLGLLINFFFSLLPLINIVYSFLIYSFGFGFIYYRIIPSKKKN